MRGQIVSRGERADDRMRELDVAAAAATLRMLGNRRRLMILARLIDGREACVGRMADALGLSPSALSQHLARMRKEGMVVFRREAQTAWYRIADPQLEELLAVLHEYFRRRPSQPGRARKCRPTAIGPR